jgi:molybdenum cofactor synthesis domain-containing protein
VRDINSYSLSALIETTGGDPIRYGIIPDNLEDLHTAAKHALDECDLVVITAGSSVSARDITSRVIDRLGSPGVLVHGVNVRPGKPTILAVCDGTPVIGLPGNPVSARREAAGDRDPTPESVRSGPAIDQPGLADRPGRVYRCPAACRGGGLPG